MLSHDSCHNEYCWLFCGNMLSACPQRTLLHKYNHPNAISHKRVLIRAHIPKTSISNIFQVIILIVNIFICLSISKHRHFATRGFFAIAFLYSVRRNYRRCNYRNNITVIDATVILTHYIWRCGSPECVVACVIHDVIPTGCKQSVYTQPRPLVSATSIKPGICLQCVVCIDLFQAGIYSETETLQHGYIPLVINYIFERPFSGVLLMGPL